VFNGDLLLAAYKPSGGMHVLLGDFTGHGLPAAIGAMPLAEVFYGMTAKGYGLTDILRELNAKLKHILPRGVFCCAALLNISFQRQEVEVWNGGLPDGYLLRQDGSRTALISRHLPLGVLEPALFNDACEVYPLALGDRVFLLSDGVLEACNAQQELFGEARLLRVLDASAGSLQLFDEIQQALHDFSGQPQDDVSLVEVCLVEERQLNRPPLAFADTGQSHLLDWSASFEFRGETLRYFNPLPFLMQLLLEVQGLRPQGGALYTVLAELYSNALEHGVLGLDSALKQNAEGFAEYYRQRSERLQQLCEGHVRFHLQLLPEGAGGRLLITVEDSGKGFDAQSLIQREMRLDRLSGRGLALIRQLSERCSAAADGQGIRVEFSWSPDA